jgi:four helix bundle protein
MAGRFQGNLPERTFQFALMILDVVDERPHNTKGWVLAKQLARAGISIGANVPEANEAFTEADFAYKCGIARKEASETYYWLRLCFEARLISQETADGTMKEADEFLRILSAIVKKTQVHLAAC